MATATKCSICYSWLYIKTPIHIDEWNEWMMNEIITIDIQYNV